MYLVLYVTCYQLLHSCNVHHVISYPENKNKNSTRRQRLRHLQRSCLELSADRTPSFIADCCNVCQALENSLVLVPELVHLRIFILRYTNVLIIITIIIITVLQE